MIQQHTRFIPSEAIYAVTHWQFAAIDTVCDLPANLPQPVAEVEKVEAVEVIATESAIATLTESEYLAQLESARQTAEAQGHARGLAEGLEQGFQQGQTEANQEWQQRMDDYVQGEGRVIAQRLGALAQTLERSLSELQQTAAKQVLQLACDIARQVVRQEIHNKPHAVLPVVREALDMLATEHQPATVFLNPQDWAVLETALRSECGAMCIQWQPDANIATGDCRIECAAAVMDGSIERRWQRAIAALGLTSVWRDDDGG